METKYRLTIQPLGPDHGTAVTTTRASFTYEDIHETLAELYGSAIESYAEGNALVTLHHYHAASRECAQVTRIKSRPLVA